MNSACCWPSAISCVVVGTRWACCTDACRLVHHCRACAFGSRWRRQSEIAGTVAATSYGFGSIDVIARQTRTHAARDGYFEDVAIWENKCWRDRPILADGDGPIETHTFCPASNLFLGSGLFDLRRLRELQVRVGLGTDVGGGTSLSLLKTMREAYKVMHLQQQPLPPGADGIDPSDYYL